MAPFPDVNPTQHEIAFGPTDAKPLVKEGVTHDVRTFTDKLLFRKAKGGELAWNLTDAGFTFTGGAGHTGTGSLWLKPVSIPAPRDEDGHIRFRGAYFHMLERRSGGVGKETLVAHVRSTATLEEGAEDLARAEFPIHAHEEGADAAWHGVYLDFTELLTPFAGTGAYLVLELQVACETALKDPDGCKYSFQKPMLSLVTSVPKYEPRASLFHH
ncbi:MAG TPA: hypothetical protein VNZ52_06150 [Candidatus Thermoplasmatota archaeon]|nr:hypothetical protein [Candidatus Thermoplasmatota archaeon]